MATHAGSGVAVDASSNTGSAVRGTTHASTGALGSVVGINNNAMGGNGVYGSAAAAASAGVRGQSTNGAGVLGYSNNNLGVSAGTLGGTALFASAIGGTALKGTSSSGYSLDVSGKVKIAGGNTNPSAGAVLTSTDANGNAVWKPTMKIAFSANGSLNKSIPNGGQQKVEFNSELYDLNNNFVPNSGSVNAGSSVFTAPVAGIYHFSTDLVLCMSSIVHNFNYGIIYLKRNGSTIASANGIINNGSASSSVYLHIDGDFNLAANDKVWIEVYQSNGGGGPQGFGEEAAFPGRFTGHLIYGE